MATISYPREIDREISWSWLKVLYGSAIMFVAAAGFYLYGFASFLQSYHAPISGPPGAIQWALLAKAEELPTQDLNYASRTYPNEVKALAGNEHMIKGYMIGLQHKTRLSRFLLVPYPPSCSYCISGPTQIIQVKMVEPVEFSAKPVLVKGVFQLKEKGDSSLFYSMDRATLVLE